MEYGTKWLNSMYISLFVSVKVSIKLLKSPHFLLPGLPSLYAALTVEKKVQNLMQLNDIKYAN